MTANRPTPVDARIISRSTSSVVTRVRPDPFQGSIVMNRYRIQSRIARGGMSSVYLAQDTQNGARVAIKVLRQERTESRLRERFLNESRAVQRIDHRAVVKLIDVGTTDKGQICLVMEYLHGSSLRRLLRHGPVSTANTISIVAAISEGLHAAHSKKIIHRDLKPENILLPQHRSSMTVAKLVDFGIARIIDAPRITTTHHVMGTPQYIAPEQAMGERVDHRADIYSLGVVMYEMLSGTLPFLGTDPELLLRQHISSPPPPLPSEQTATVIPTKLNQLIMRCLQKNPINRPSDMPEVMNYLKETK